MNAPLRRSRNSRSGLHGVKEGHVAEAHVLQHDRARLPNGQGDDVGARLYRVEGHELLQRGLLCPVETADTGPAVFKGQLRLKIVS